MSITTKYDNGRTVSFFVESKKFIEHKTKELDISSEAINGKLAKVKNKTDLDALVKEYSEDKYVTGLKSLSPYFENTNNWNDPIGEYIYRKYINPRRPKFLYYDEYYTLPSRISIEKLNSKSLDEAEYKTAKNLFELADIDTNEIIAADSFEDFIAELEATEAIISGELFKYWHTNKNLQITFQIDKKRKQTEIITSELLSIY